MEDHMHDEDDTLSLSDLHIDANNINSKELSNTNQSSSSSSSSSCSFDQDFLGFFSEEWSRDSSYNTSPENIIFCGKIVSSKLSVTKDRKPKLNTQISPLFRSSSDSFRFVKTASRVSTPRSKSLQSRLSSSSSGKSKWQVFMFGFGSNKFPTTMDMSDIKIRQLRRESTLTVTDHREIGGQRNGKKAWWRLVDALGCSGGYEIDRHHDSTSFKLPS